MPTDPENPYVSRGGLKLAHAIAAFGLEVRGATAADLGCSTGGFTDCLLKHGAARVYAVDTAYGELAWVLRKDPRVVVMERTNALHADAPERCGLVVCDMSWTPQRLVVPAALRWCAAGGRIVTLIKPHYEAKELGVRVPRGGVLGSAEAEDVARRVAGRVGEWGASLLGLACSPIVGGKGNAEWLALLAATLAR